MQRPLWAMTLDAHEWVHCSRPALIPESLSKQPRLPTHCASARGFEHSELYATAHWRLSEGFKACQDLNQYNGTRQGLYRAKTRG